MTVNIGIQMNQKDLTKSFMMISNWIKPFGLQDLYIQRFLFIGVRVRGGGGGDRASGTALGVNTPCNRLLTDLTITFSRQSVVIVTQLSDTYDVLVARRPYDMCGGR